MICSGDVNNTGQIQAVFASEPPQRVVSLVPSYTETLFALGLGETVVGVTEYCIYPPRARREAQVIGGTKTPQVERILSLRPNLVIANQEENSRVTIEALRDAGIRVWLTFPRTVKAAVDLLGEMARIFHSPGAMEIYGQSAAQLALAQSRRPAHLLRCFCPIWQGESEQAQEWWMTFNGETYSSDLLAWLGLENIFHQRQRRYPLAADLGQVEAEEPGERDTRYPRVTREEICAAGPEIILLPDEPYLFTPGDLDRMADLFKETRAAITNQIYRVDGTLITWCGIRTLSALEILSRLTDNPRID